MSQSNAIDRTGQRLGKLVAVRAFDRSSGGTLRWLYQCDCGNTKVSYPQSASQTGHCGCLTHERLSARFVTHGRSGCKMYKAWFAMKDRCQNPNNQAFHHYGGRGISFDPSWDKFESFLKDMGERPNNTTLERVDNDGNYCKENCIWATRKVQQRNRRGLNMHGGKCLSEIAENLNLSRNTIAGRLNRGWSIQDATTKPISVKNRNNRKRKNGIL